jgi:hypothetical protein
VRWVRGVWAREGLCGLCWVREGVVRWEMGEDGFWVLRQEGVIPIFGGTSSINRLFVGDRWMHTCTTLLFVGNWIGKGGVRSLAFVYIIRCVYSRIDLPTT